MSVVDKSGNKVETEYFDLANYSTVGGLLSGSSIGLNDKFTNLTASVSNGNLVLAAGSGQRVSVNEFTSSMTGAGKVASGFSFLP